MDSDPQFDALMLLFLILCLLKLPPPPTVNGPSGPQDFRLDASTLQTKKKTPPPHDQTLFGCRRQLSVVLLSFSFYNGEVCVPSHDGGGAFHSRRAS